MSHSKLLLCLGYGYCAQYVATRLDRASWRIVGTARRADKAAAIRRDQVEAMVFDGGDASQLPVEGAHLLVSAPPSAEGCPVFRALRSRAAAAASVTYLSTTGVYGDLAGGWAFERTPVNPQSPRGRARVAAERQWFGLGAPVRTVRLPGIYGPGRSPFGRLRDGSARRIVKPGQVFSRAHVEDIASALVSMLERSELTGVFHICDDEPAPPQDVTAYAARLLGGEPPPEVSIEDADLSAMAASFYAECKRVSNARAKAALGWRPEFPTYREGLQAVLAAETVN